MKAHVFCGFAAFALACSLAACSGGGSPVTPQPVPISKTSAHQVAVAFTLLVPQTTKSSSRRAQYVSLGTKSVTVNQVAMNVSAASPNCATVAGGLSCTLQLKMTPGQQMFVVSTYDQPLTANGMPQGDQLSSATAFATIVEGQANTVKVTLAGIPAKVQIAISNPNPPMGTAAVIPISLNVEDAAGYTIVGPWSAYVELTATTSQSLSPANLAFQVNGQSTSWVTGPSDTVSLVYPGSGARNVTIGASLQFGGTLAGTTTFAPTPAFGSEIAVGTSLVNAEAVADSSYQQLIWFTEPAKNKVAQYTPSSATIQEWAVPSGGSPQRMSYDLDQLTFTESNNNIGTLSLAMVSVGDPTPITEHTLTNANAGAYVVKALMASTYVSEKTAGGFAVPSFGDPLAGWTPGPDAFYSSGASHSAPAGMGYSCPASNGGTEFLMADSGADEIDCVTAAGGFTRHSLTVGAHPTEVTDFDQNKYWWFIEPGISKIASMDQSANVTEYPSPGVPKAICADQTTVVVLTTTGGIEVFDESTGTLLGTYTPPASSNGPAVWIDASSTPGSILILRSDGIHGSIQTFTYD